MPSSAARPTRIHALLGVVAALVLVGTGTTPSLGSSTTGVELPENGRIVYAFVSDPLLGYDIRSIGEKGKRAAKLAMGTGSSEAPQVSPDGTKIAFFQHADLAVMNIDGSHQQRLTNTAEYQTEVRWSPDGTTLAYLNLSAPTTTQLYTIPAAGGEPRVSAWAPPA